MPLLFSAKLLEFTDSQDPEQLAWLESLLAEAVASGLTQDAKSAFLGLFERFPEEDGFGIFWSILHVLESAGNYESELVASVRRMPGAFNTCMVYRIANGGSSTIAGIPIENLLQEVLRNPNTKPSVIEEVQDYLNPTLE